MARIGIVAYRPHPGRRQDVLRLLGEQHRLVRTLGFIGKREPWLMEGVDGEIVYVAAFEGARQVDACWENEAFQDIDSQLLQVAEMVPLRSLQEASGPYLDFEELAASDTTIGADHGLE